MDSWWDAVFGTSTSGGGGWGVGGFDLGGALADVWGGLGNIGSWFGRNLVPMMTSLGGLGNIAGAVTPYLMPPDQPRKPTTGTSYPGHLGGAYQPASPLLPPDATPRREIRRLVPPDLQVRGVYSGGVVSPEALAALGMYDDGGGGVGGYPYGGGGGPYPYPWW